MNAQCEQRLTDLEAMQRKLDRALAESRALRDQVRLERRGTEHEAEIGCWRREVAHLRALHLEAVNGWREARREVAELSGQVAELCGQASGLAAENEGLRKLLEIVRGQRGL
jgi:chromosome segregation ATPase